MLRSEQEGLFNEWLNSHKGLIMKAVRAYSDTQADQDDLQQEVLLQVWRSVPRFRQECKPSTWIYRVAFNTAMTWIRSEKKHRHAHQSTPAVEDIPEPNMSDNDSEGALEWLYAEIRKFSKADRSLILLHLDGLSYREVADVLGISETNVGVKLTRMRKQLVTTLEGVSHEL